MIISTLNSNEESMKPGETIINSVPGFLASSFNGFTLSLGGTSRCYNPAHRQFGLDALVALTSLASGPQVRPQEAGPPQESRRSTVIKGKAPVAKKLLKVRFPQPKLFTLSNGARIYV